MTRPDHDSKTERETGLAVFQDRLGYHFTHPEYLERALMHSSRGVDNYERLEFLGDRVLGLVIAEIFYRFFPFAVLDLEVFHRVTPGQRTVGILVPLEDVDELLLDEGPETLVCS